MMEMTYKDLKNYAHGFSNDGIDKKLLNNIINRLSILFSEEDFVLTYAKNLFIDHKNLEIIILSKNNKIVISKVNDSSTVEINVLDLKNVEYFSITVPNNHEYHMGLDIKFKNGTTISLNSSTDTNEYWDDKFAEVIRDFIRHLYSY